MHVGHERERRQINHDVMEGGEIIDRAEHLEVAGKMGKLEEYLAF